MKKMPPGSESQKKDMEDEDDDEDSYSRPRIGKGMLSNIAP